MPTLLSSGETLHHHRAYTEVRVRNEGRCTCTCVRKRTYTGLDRSLYGTSKEIIKISELYQEHI